MLPFFICVRPAGRTCLEVPRQPRYQKRRAGRKPSAHPTGGSVSWSATAALWGSVGRKLNAKHWPDEQETHTRYAYRMRTQISLKSHNCTIRMHVYVAGKNVKAGVHYPGISCRLPGAMFIKRWSYEVWEVSRGNCSLDRPGWRFEREHESWTTFSAKWAYNSNRRKSIQVCKYETVSWNMTVVFGPFNVIVNRLLQHTLNGLSR